MGDFSVDEIEPERCYSIRPRINNVKPVYMNIDTNSINKMLLKCKAIQEHFYPKIKFVSPVADKIVNITVLINEELYSIGDYKINYDLKNFNLEPLNFDPKFKPERSGIECIIDRNTNRMITLDTVYATYHWLINKA